MYCLREADVLREAWLASPAWITSIGVIIGYRFLNASSRKTYYERIGEDRAASKLKPTNSPTAYSRGALTDHHPSQPAPPHGRGSLMKRVEDVRAYIELQMDSLAPGSRGWAYETGAYCHHTLQPLTLAFGFSRWPSRCGCSRWQWS